MPKTKPDDFFLQGSCNCQRCRDERRTMSQSKYISKLEKALPFKPLIYDAEQGYNGHAWTTIEELDASISTLIDLNKKAEKKAKGQTIKYAHCISCGLLHKKIKKTKHKVSGKVHYICQTCLNNLYFFCHECNKFLLKVDGTHVRDEWYCKPCAKVKFSNCCVCNELNYAEDLADYSDNPFVRYDGICPKCIKTHVIECEECSTAMRKDESQSLDGKILCRVCYEANLPIHSYNYKPPAMFQVGQCEKKRDDKYYFGMELELEFEGNYGENSVAKYILKTLGKDKVYMKHDGSLRGDSFEIVTHPMSWQMYKQGKKVWDDLMKVLKDKYKATIKSGRCGMHVHINKRSFTTCHSYKFIDFIYKVINRPFIIYVSGRGGYTSGFNQYATLPDLSKPETLNLKRCAKSKTGTNHHYAVDVTPSRTFEVRIFNGVDKAEDLHKNIEFCYAVYEFTKDISLLKNNTQNFMYWLEKRNKTYPNLWSYLIKNRKLLSDYNLYDLAKGTN